MAVSATVMLVFVLIFTSAPARAEKLRVHAEEGACTEAAARPELVDELSLLQMSTSSRLKSVADNFARAFASVKGGAESGNEASDGTKVASADKEDVTSR